MLAGIPPGQYLVTLTLPGSGRETVEYVELGTGQTLQVDLDVAATSIKGVEQIEISGRRVDAKTSEVATDVSQEQIANLPQSNRNFLNFAQLAPGVRVSNDEFNRNAASGALEVRQTNVFIDGVSLKNNVVEGGVAGQDRSRGNPFPQLAIAGFRVLTQNYKAEYEQAGAAIISSVTRSGGNELHGELYSSFQNRSMTSIDPFIEKANQPKPTYARYQLGGLLSGPIIKDRLFALATYEGNYQNRANQVAIGNATEMNLMRFGQYQGSFTSPFREHLGFAKLTWLPSPEHTVDLSTSLRLETDIRDFGGEQSYDNAQNFRNNVFTASLRHQWRADNALVNEANVQFLQSRLNPVAQHPDQIGQSYFGVIRNGGHDTEEDIVQRTVTLRDDLTFPTVTAVGYHQFKVGAKLAFQHYQIERTLFGNPVFEYREDPHTLDEVPFEAVFGVGDPRVTSNDTQIGLYAQDDWQVNNKLTLNLGVRWDIETNPLNNDYKTPDDVRAAVTEFAPKVAELNGPDFFRVNNYLTDGSQRPIYLGAVQPRIGASYDLRGDQNTVLFAGAGRYFDRTLFNVGVDERLRLQYGVRKFRFSRDGMPSEGLPTIMWDPSYLSRQGLQGLIDSSIAPAPEIFLLENDTRPLHSDQISAGVRQTIGPVNLSVTFSHIRGEHGVGFYPASREATGKRDFIPTPGGFGNVFISADDLQSRFTGLYLTAEKPYTEATKWGVSATYTLGWAKGRGDTRNSFSFSFDFPTFKATPLTASDSDERHRLVVSGIAGLPQGFMLSTLIALGTGFPYNIVDARAGFGGDQLKFLRNDRRADGFLQFKQIDLRVAKAFNIVPHHRVMAFVEAFNVFNWYNYAGYNGFIPPTGNDPNPNFGKPTRLSGPARSFQLGMTYGF